MAFEEFVRQRTEKNNMLKTKERHAARAIEIAKGIFAKLPQATDEMGKPKPTETDEIMTDHGAYVKVIQVPFPDKSGVKSYTLSVAIENDTPVTYATVPRHGAEIIYADGVHKGGYSEAADLEVISILEKVDGEVQANPEAIEA